MASVFDYIFNVVGNFTALYCQALWLERWRNRNLAELIAAMFGEGKR